MSAVLAAAEICVIHGYYVTSSALHITGSEEMNWKSGWFEENWTKGMALYLLLICLPFFFFYSYKYFFRVCKASFPLLCLLPSEGLVLMLNRLYEYALPARWRSTQAGGRTCKLQINAWERRVSRKMDKEIIILFFHLLFLSTFKEQKSDSWRLFGEEERRENVELHNS